MSKKELSNVTPALFSNSLNIIILLFPFLLFSTYNCSPTIFNFFMFLFQKSYFNNKNIITILIQVSILFPNLYLKVKWRTSLSELKSFYHFVSFFTCLMLNEPTKPHLVEKEGKETSKREIWSQFWLSYFIFLIFLFSNTFWMFLKCLELTFWKHLWIID